jgi:cbb3-type cytochrome oxidase cytochrome c subunit
VVREAAADLRAQADPDADASGWRRAIPRAQQRNFDGRPGLTEMDALVAYLQVLGTMAEFGLAPARPGDAADRTPPDMPDSTSSCAPPCWWG